jgi:hypothetical protein
MARTANSPAGGGGSKCPPHRGIIFKPGISNSFNLVSNISGTHLETAQEDTPFLFNSLAFHIAV